MRNYCIMFEHKFLKAECQFTVSADSKEEAYDVIERHLINNIYNWNVVGTDVIKNKEWK